MINDCLDDVENVWKYVDDMTFGVSGPNSDSQLQTVVNNYQLGLRRTV